MRNGLYRVWLKWPHGTSTGAVVVKDGDIFAVDRQFAFNGRLTERAGMATANITAKRLRIDQAPVNLPDLDTITITLEGASGAEYAQLSGSIPQVPGFRMSLECSFLGEV